MHPVKFRLPFKLAIASSIIMPLILIGAMNFYYVYNHYTFNAFKEKKNKAYFAATVIKEKINMMIDVATSYADRPVLLDFIYKNDYENALKLIQNAPVIFPYIDGIFITDDQGILSAGFPNCENIVGKSFAYRDWYKGVIKKWEPYLSEVYKRANPPQIYVIAVAVPIKISSHPEYKTVYQEKIHKDVIGILTLQVKIENFRQWLTEIYSDETGFIYLIDQKGNMVSHNNYSIEETFFDHKSDPITLKLLSKEQGAHIYKDRTNEDILAAYNPVPSYGWGVVVGEPAKDAFAHRNRILKEVVIFYSILIVISLFIIMLVFYFVFMKKKFEIALVQNKEQLKDLLEKRTMELSKFEKHYSSLVESISDAIYRCDPETFEIVYINDPIRKITGYIVSEFIDNTELFIRIIHPEDKNLVVDFLKEAKKESKSSFIEYRIIKKGGAISWLSNKFSWGKDNDNKIISLNGILSDITERKNAEILLMDSEMKFKALFDCSNDAILTIEPPYWLVSSVNKAALELFGIAEMKYLSQLKISDFSPELQPDQKDSITKAFQMIEIALKKGICTFDWTMKKQNGELFPTTITFTKVKLEKKEFIQVIVRDKTKQKELEDRLSHAQKMEAVGTLAGGVAHDFNNMLNIILGFASLMKAKLTDTDPLLGSLKEVINAANRAAQITKGLLAFSRKQSVVLRPINVAEQIKNLEQTLRRLIGENIELHINCPDEKLTLMADASQIDQVLINLSSNSRDAMPDGGKLAINFKKVKVSEIQDLRSPEYPLDEDSEYLEISVIDTGTGMDQKTLERIFEPYFTTKEVGKGTGLGLPIVYGIVQQHKGYIFCASKPGKGTTFRIYIPILEAEEAITKDTFQPPTKGNEESILLVEDESGVRRVIKTALENYSYKVVEAADGEEALQKYNQYKDKISLILTDCVIPRQSGFELYETLKKFNPSIKFLFMSGYSEDVVDSKELSAKGLDYIRKPFLPEEIAAKIREILLDR